MVTQSMTSIVAALGLALCPASASDGVDVEEVLQQAAIEVLESMGRAVAEAPALRCATKVHVQSPGRDQEIVVQSRFGPDGACEVRSDTSRVVCVSGVLNMVDENIHDRYIQIPVGERVSDGIAQVFGDREMAGFEMLMRDGYGPEVWLEPLLMRAVGSPVPVGLRRQRDASGQEIIHIELSGQRGRGSVDIDAATRLLVGASAIMEITPEAGADPIQWKMDLTTESEVVDELDRPIQFDPGARVPVTSRADLDPIARNRVRVGQVAPSLKAQDLDGVTADLEEFQGQPVILCFWTSWAPASARCMPQLVALTETHPDVQVLAVNVMERASGLDDRLDQAKAIWAQGGWPIRTLVDSDDTIQTDWGITTAPFLVLLDPQGRIARRWSGYRADWDEDVREALGSLEVAPTQ